MEKTKAFIAKNHQLLLYSLIGCSGVMLDLLLFALLFNMFGVDKNLATLMSTLTGMTNNFLLNAYFNFKVHSNLLRRLLEFYCVGLVGIVITVLLFKLFADSMGMNANVVKVGSLPLILIVQFLLNKHWTFK